MDVITDVRLTELRVLENLASRTWDSGISLGNAAGQTSALGISQRLYADLIVTLLEDRYLLNTSSSPELKNLLLWHEHNKDQAGRNRILDFFSSSTIYIQMSVTYRGLRHIDALRDQLRSERILESFGILLDGRYLVSDLIHHLERMGGNSLSLLFADVDNFGQFNKMNGYKAGDAVLRHVFRTMKEIVGARGEVYRRGGEEVVALLPYCDLNEGREVAERIRDLVDRTPIAYETTNLHVTLSIGVSASPPCNPDGPSLEAHAEIGLKQAKSTGKNRVTVNGL